MLDQLLPVNHVALTELEEEVGQDYGLQVEEETEI